MTPTQYDKYINLLGTDKEAADLYAKDLHIRAKVKEFIDHVRDAIADEQHVDFSDEIAFLKACIDDYRSN
jgi:hypothetical protein